MQGGSTNADGSVNYGNTRERGVSRWESGCEYSNYLAHGIDIIVSVLIFVDGILTFGASFANALLPIYYCGFAVIIGLFVFYVPPRVYWMFPFYFNWFGRGCVFLFLGLLVMQGRDDFDIGAGVFVVIVAFSYWIVFVLYRFSPQFAGCIIPPPLMQVNVNFDEYSYGYNLKEQEMAPISLDSPRSGDPEQGSIAANKSPQATQGAPEEAVKFEIFNPSQDKGTVPATASGGGEVAAVGGSPVGGTAASMGTQHELNHEIQKSPAAEAEAAPVEIVNSTAPQQPHEMDVSNPFSADDSNAPSSDTTAEKRYERTGGRNLPDSVVAFDQNSPPPDQQPPQHQQHTTMVVKSTSATSDDASNPFFSADLDADAPNPEDDSPPPPEDHDLGPPPNTSVPSRPMDEPWNPNVQSLPTPANAAAVPQQEQQQSYPPPEEELKKDDSQAGTAAEHFGKPIQSLPSTKLENYNSAIPTVLVDMERQFESCGGYAKHGVFHPDGEPETDPAIVLSHALAAFFVELPEPMLESVDSQLVDKALNVEAMPQLMAEMAEPYASVLCFLWDMLARVAGNEEQTGMGSPALAQVFGPQLGTRLMKKDLKGHQASTNALAASRYIAFCRRGIEWRKSQLGGRRSKSNSLVEFM